MLESFSVNRFSTLPSLSFLFSYLLHFLPPLSLLPSDISFHLLSGLYNHFCPFPSFHEEPFPIHYLYFRQGDKSASHFRYFYGMQIKALFVVC